MKMFKKVVSVAMCIVMILGMANVSFAGESNNLNSGINTELEPNYDDLSLFYAQDIFVFKSI